MSETLEVLTLEGTVRLKENIVNILLPKYIEGFTIAPSQWETNTYTFTCSAIKKNSIIDIYYAESSREYVESLNVEYGRGDGYIKIIASSTPTENIEISSIVITNPFEYYTES